ncbi:MAG TPA: Gfo/Idh/MocA family oxidoreductase [Pseudonocardiaceae bacterium]|nr:Gfo/Idh/MocA family oxidoreductase [Pseudonocardiaceae bacterium]
MSRTPIGIAMNGVTGRMGYRQHLLRSILAIREQGGYRLADGTLLWPEPLLVGRSETKLRDIANRHGLTRWTTSLEKALAEGDIEIYFDAQLTSAREPAVAAAIEAGKHIYAEKPTATTLAGAVHLARLADARGVRTGVVADKLFLPGLRKLRRLADAGFFGRVLSVGIEFGYWVFEGDWQPAQRPSWNYRAQDGGGIISDMFPHWRYVLEDIVAPVRSVYATGSTAIPERFDEQGRPYAATAEDIGYAILELDGGVLATIRSSWATRVNRDELVQIHVDGTEGSAVAGLWSCRVQHRATTPKAVWNPDLPTEHQFRADWQEVPANTEFDNGFKAQWEAFLSHVVADTPFPWDLMAGARGVQLAELAMESARAGRKVAIPELAG